MIMTVAGEMPDDNAGVTLMHEHLLIERQQVTGDYDEMVNDEKLAEVELAAYAAAGGVTLVDLTVAGIGRNPDALQRLSAATGVHIVMGSGWYLEPYHPSELARLSVDELAAGLVSEFVSGAGGTDVRPGIIGEVASGLTISPAEERSFRASARAQREVGCALSTHAWGAPIGHAQLDILEEEGVDLSRVIVGHLDSIDDSDYHVSIAERGAWVQFDLLRAVAEWDVARQIRLVKEFVDRGLADRLLLSHDVCRRSQLSAYGGRGYTGIFDFYLPRLVAAGVPADALDQVLSANPARALAWR